MPVEKRALPPTYSKNNGLFVIDIDAVKNLPFTTKEKSLVNVPPKAMGGNHKHPRWEAFVGLGEGLKLIWLNDSGKKQEDLMNPEETLYLFIVSPNTPHAVLNTSASKPGILLEFASETQHDIQRIKLL